MKIAYFDTIAGISGDMTLGAFVSAGMSFDLLSSEIRKLGLRGVELEASRVVRNGISAMKVDVVISGEQKGHRHLKQINEIIDGSGLHADIRNKAKDIFMEVAAAEAKVHDTTVEKIHFHEVGALDSIADIVGAAVCVHHLGIERIHSSPVKMGQGGFVNTEHGKLPVPGPAAVEILRGYPTVLTDIPYELTTPTGAAIVKALSAGVLAPERIVVSAVGYGAGAREMKEVPNLLRVLVGELAPGPGETVKVIEVNIDDMTPEIIPFVMEKLFAAGALDVFVVPVIMKKGRPGYQLTALARQERAAALAEIILRETSTIGVRMSDAERIVLPRESVTVRTSFGPTAVKQITRNGAVTLVPEFEECRRLALETGIPLLEVYRTIETDLAALSRGSIS